MGEGERRELAGDERDLLYAGVGLFVSPCFVSFVFSLFLLVRKIQSITCDDVHVGLANELSVSHKLIG